MINLTLVIQVIHFWIAYLILDTILLRSAVALIQKENCETDSLERRVEEIATELAVRATQKEQEWHMFQHQLQHQKPAFERYQLEPVERVAAEKFSPLSVQNVTELAQQMKKLMVTRMMHD